MVKTEISGIVKEKLPNALFKVELEDGREILAHISGKMRLHQIKVVPGDSVRVELSPYDQARGRVVYRSR